MATPAPTSVQSLFFYGTLMAPSVLHRVISSTSQNPKRQNLVHPTNGTDSNPLIFHPALLPQHRRRRVKGADYPAVTPDTSAACTGVRGTLVKGLSERDVRKLDLFEGDEYTRQEVEVRLPDGQDGEGGVPEPLAYGGVMPASEASTSTSTNGHGGVEDDEGKTVKTQTYIWHPSLSSQLEDQEWDFEQFRREKLHLWAGDVVRDSGMDAADALGLEEGPAEALTHDGRDGMGEAEAGGVVYAQGATQQVDGTRGRGIRSGGFEKLVAESEREAQQEHSIA